jgi:steroid delta-isomerase-like uncharacterized protein
MSTGAYGLSADEAEAMVRRRFAELDSGNAGILDELFSPDYTLNFPGSAPRNLEETKQFYQELYTAFPDLNHEIQDQIAEGDKVVTRWAATGTHRGEFMGIPPTGRSVSFEGINIYTLSGDKLVASHVNWDLLGLQAALTDEAG